MSAFRALRLIVSDSLSTVRRGFTRVGQITTLGKFGTVVSTVVGLAVVMFVAEYFGLL